MKPWPIVKCRPGGAQVLRVARADRNEYAALHPEPRAGGRFVIVGFARIRAGDVVPLVADVRNVHGVPAWDEMPEWARRKRWNHHAPECRGVKSAGLRRL